MVNWPELPERPGDLDALTQLHIEVVRAESYLRSGDTERFIEIASHDISRRLNQFREAAGQVAPNTPYEGYGIYWQMTCLSRQAGSVELVSRFAAPRLADPAESVVAQSVFAQVEHQARNERVGALVVGETRDRFARHAPRDPQRTTDSLFNQQYGYHTDWETSFTELLAAAWVALGRDVAMQMARDRYGRDRSWIFPVAVRVAQVYRVYAIPRDRSRGGDAMNAAFNSRFRDEQYPVPADLAMFGYEAASHGLFDQLSVFLNRNDDPVVHGFVALGVAEALLQSE